MPDERTNETNDRKFTCPLHENAMIENHSDVNVIYLHGFQSSSRSEKAQILSAYLKNLEGKVSFHAPDLPFSPGKTLAQVGGLLDSMKGKKILLVGSSMGGFYASYLSQRHQLPAVLINPAVSAFPLFESFSGQELQNNYTQERHIVSQQDITTLKEIENIELVHKNLIFCLLETGDEVLDYRLAEKKYQFCKLKIIAGGNHRFKNFESCLPGIMTFFFNLYSKKAVL